MKRNLELGVDVPAFHLTRTVLEQLVGRGIRELPHGGERRHGPRAEPCGHERQRVVVSPQEANIRDEVVADGAPLDF